MTDDAIYCASGDGNIAVEYATHPANAAWRVPLCKRCAAEMRMLQETSDKMQKESNGRAGRRNPGYE